MNTEQKQCEVCGARVRNWSPRVTTCDRTCTKAKHAGRTRAQQFLHEMKMEALRDFPDEQAYVIGGDLELSNRPYLAAAFA